MERRHKKSGGENNKGAKSKPKNSEEKKHDGEETAHSSLLPSRASMSTAMDGKKKLKRRPYKGKEELALSCRQGRACARADMRHQKSSEETEKG